ncbi:MAG: four helix bundle protein [Bacteroidetes bacterium]|nr:four helix bundle protein [Bacteroidota bacterium]
MNNLEERTLKYAVQIRSLIKKIPLTIFLIEDLKQLIRSSGSLGANYIEANEALSKKDFILRLKISLKETKESEYWLKVIMASNTFENRLVKEFGELINETTELRKILASILQKSR